MEAFKYAAELMKLLSTTHTTSSKELHIYTYDSDQKKIAISKYDESNQTTTQESTYLFDKGEKNQLMDLNTKYFPHNDIFTSEESQKAIAKFMTFAQINSENQNSNFVNHLKNDSDYKGDSYFTA